MDANRGKHQSYQETSQCGQMTDSDETRETHKSLMIVAS